jgi:hypothetical protein
MFSENWPVFQKRDLVALVSELNRLQGLPPVTIADIDRHVAQDSLGEWLQNSFARLPRQTYRSLAWLGNQVLAPSRALYEALVMTLARFIS